MSAFILNHDHITAMLDVALMAPSDAPRGPQGWSTFSWYHGRSTHKVRFDTNRVGQMLVNENVASVAYRYHEDDEPENYVYMMPRFRRVPTIVEAFRIIGCYEYQSCEHSGWETSEAKAFCDSLKEELIRCLPGYLEAPYEWVA